MSMNPSNKYLAESLYSLHTPPQEPWKALYKSYTSHGGAVRSDPSSVLHFAAKLPGIHVAVCLRATLDSEITILNTGKACPACARCACVARLKVPGPGS